MTYHEIIKIAMGSIKKQNKQITKRQNNEGTESQTRPGNEPSSPEQMEARKHVGRKFCQT